MKILVLGGYGLIGSAIARRLEADGHDVVGLGRDPEIGRNRHPSIPWIGVDMAALSSVSAWSRYLDNVDFVVNAAGALQDGARDDLAAIHDTSVVACVKACQKLRINGFVQISALGADSNASTAFMKTKARGDDAVRACELNWVIFKPGLVIGRDAYGGTSLLRMIASFPGVVPIIMPDAVVSVVDVDDVAHAVSSAIAGKLEMKRTIDLVADEQLSLQAIVLLFRQWLGKTARSDIFRLPTFFGVLIAKFTDLMGWFGWRSPLRTTTIKVLNEGIIGDPSHWASANNDNQKPLLTLQEILAKWPATAAERQFGRAQLIIPFLVAVLSIFWVTSGVFGLVRLDQSAAYISAPAGLGVAKVLIILASIIDMVIGLMFILRPATKIASVAAVIVSSAYLFAGTVFAPSLWLDPLGPFVKIFPVIAAATTLYFLWDDR